MDELDQRILQALQENCAISYTDLAERVHSSAPTCMRRVQKLKAAGWIAREVAILDSDKIGRELGWGLHAIVEISLEQQNTQWLDEFERAACACPEVQQCWRTSAGPDFVLVLQVRDMPAYHAWASSLLATDKKVRNVKTYFASKRAKFDTAINLVGAGAQPNAASTASARR
jgi:Lrp/AsnC family leucine-responsive transcriptional regulator